MRTLFALLLLLLAPSLCAGGELQETGRFDPTIYAAYQVDPSREAALEDVIGKSFEPMRGAYYNKNYTTCH